MDPLTIASTSLDIVSFLRGRPRDGQENRAMRALYSAVEDTGAYLQRLQDGGIRDLSKERKLAELWRKAANAVRPMNQDLAERLWFKGDFWMNPDEWSHKWIDRRRIGFTEVKSELDAMMRASA